MTCGAGAGRSLSMEDVIKKITELSSWAVPGQERAP